MEVISNSLDLKFNEMLNRQVAFEASFCMSNKKLNGVFLTNNASIVESVLKNVPNDRTILENTFLEPSCGHGAFIIKLIMKAYLAAPNVNDISNFIQTKLFFVDIDLQMIETTKTNVSALFTSLFGSEYKGSFNAYCADFTRLDDDLFESAFAVSNLYGKVDFVIGNPPYITLYGRRDQKLNENQRIYFLKNYSQFPSSLKNGKINYIMLFIERGLKTLNKGGKLVFVIDVSFFETAYVYCRKYLLENYTINSLTYNLQGFDGVASGQIIIEISNLSPNANSVLVVDAETGRQIYVDQSKWNRPEDEYKFRISHCEKLDLIVKKIFDKGDPKLEDLYPKKNLRTCVMLLDMEEQFTSALKSNSVTSYPYYRGSGGLKYKYSKLHYKKYFHYDKKLQDDINDKLKYELLLRGIKNKKRVGLGETVIYDNPKVYIRQSAKELIASYDEIPSSANNSLYVFSLRNNTPESLRFLKYLCGLLNSEIYTFFAQQRRIIRYNKGKQPQIKTSDLYQIFIPIDKELTEKIAHLVDQIYINNLSISRYKNEIDNLLYSYYKLNVDEVSRVRSAIESFLE